MLIMTLSVWYNRYPLCYDRYRCVMAVSRVLWQLSVVWPLRVVSWPLRVVLRPLRLHPMNTWATKGAHKRLSAHSNSNFSVDHILARSALTGYANSTTKSEKVYVFVCTYVLCTYDRYCTCKSAWLQHQMGLPEIEAWVYTCSCVYICIMYMW
jgi:hypothetical protein